MPDASPLFRRVLDTSPAPRHELSSNESPYGPLPSVAAAITQAVRDVNRYPDPEGRPLISAIAARLAVPAEHVAIGSGSAAVLKQVIDAVAHPGAEVVYPWRSFEAYPDLCDLAGVVSVPVPLRGDDHDLAAMATAITPRTRLILVCNPNNPTGTTVAKDDLVAFLGCVPGNCLVVLDEAYRQYARDGAAPDGVGLYADRPNVAVLRTFSKAYGLAGLRVGFLVGQAAMVEAVRKRTLPFTVSSLAQVAAIASLAADRELLERVEATVKERDRVRGVLLADGWTVPRTEANFVWLRLGEDTTPFAAACAQAGIALRPFAGEGARVSIGTPEANDAFLTVAHRYIRKIGY